MAPGADALKPSVSDQLQQLIRTSRASDVGFAAHLLATREEILIKPDMPFHPASTMKVCVMMEVFRQARLGTISLTDPVPVYNQFVSIADGSPYSLKAEDDSEKDLYARVGETASIYELVLRMITVSSNLATNILLEHVSPQQVTAFMRALGTDDLIVRRGVEDNEAYRQGMNNSATARGFMLILLKLAKREIVSSEDSDAMINILARQQFNEMIPALLPRGTLIAHKTGWTGDYHHDIGLIYPSNGEPFVLSILTKGYAEADERDAHAFVASMAKTIFDHWDPG
jgi:beta-lactamase class A